MRCTRPSHWKMVIRTATKIFNCCRSKSWLYVNAKESTNWVRAPRLTFKNNRQNHTLCTPKFPISICQGSYCQCRWKNIEKDLKFLDLGKLLWTNSIQGTKQLLLPGKFSRLRSLENTCSPKWDHWKLWHQVGSRYHYTRNYVRASTDGNASSNHAFVSIG